MPADPALLETTILHGNTGTVKTSDLLAGLFDLDTESARALPIRKLQTIFRDQLDTAAEPLATGM